MLPPSLFFVPKQLNHPVLSRFFSVFPPFFFFFLLTPTPDFVTPSPNLPTPTPTFRKYRVFTKKWYPQTQNFLPHDCFLWSNFFNIYELENVLTQNTCLQASPKKFLTFFKTLVHNQVLKNFRLSSKHQFTSKSQKIFDFLQNTRSQAFFDSHFSKTLGYKQVPKNFRLSSIHQPTSIF